MPGEPCTWDIYLVSQLECLQEQARDKSVATYSARLYLIPYTRFITTQPKARQLSFIERICPLGQALLAWQIWRSPRCNISPGLFRNLLSCSISFTKRFVSQGNDKVMDSVFSVLQRRDRPTIVDGVNFSPIIQIITWLVLGMSIMSVFTKVLTKRAISKKLAYDDLLICAALVHMQVLSLR